MLLWLVLGSIAALARALTPSVGVVSDASRKVTVIGTSHAPSRAQREEVAALIAAERPDVVLVELDAERLQLLWGGDRNVYGGELYEAVRAARAADAPVARR